MTSSGTRALPDVALVVVHLLDERRLPIGSHASTPQPEPWTVVVASVSCALKRVEVAEVSSIAAASSPSGLPPPSGLRFVQKMRVQDVARQVEGEVLLQPDDGAEVALVARLGQLLQRVVAPLT